MNRPMPSDAYFGFVRNLATRDDDACLNVHGIKAKMTPVGPVEVDNGPGKKPTYQYVAFRVIKEHMECPYGMAFQFCMTELRVVANMYVQATTSFPSAKHLATTLVDEFRAHSMLGRTKVWALHIAFATLCNPRRFRREATNGQWNFWSTGQYTKAVEWELTWINYPGSAMRVDASWGQPIPNPCGRFHPEVRTMYMFGQSIVHWRIQVGTKNKLDGNNIWGTPYYLAPLPRSRKRGRVVWPIIRTKFCAHKRYKLRSRSACVQLEA